MANTRRNRRGLSTIVGAVFMILVTVGALNVVLWTLQQQDMVTESIIEKSNANLDKLNEGIEISDVRVTGANKLSMTVTNTGGAAATLKSLYAIDETASPKTQERYDLDLVVDGRESLQNVGESLALVIADDHRYSIRLVTESGNTVTTTLTPLSSVILPMELYVIPPTVAPGDRVTILFTVTNNLVDTALSEDIIPVLTLPQNCSPPSCVLTEVTAPSGSISIPPGTTRLFKWVYEVQAPDETSLTFSATLAGANPANFVTEDVFVRLIEESQISTSTTQIIYTSLVQKPEIFLVLPSPFGDNDQRGLWGVVVSNPTEVPMTVSRIVISAYTAKTTGGGSSEMIGIGNGCEVAIYPNDASEWICPHANMIQWMDVDDPEVVDPLSSKSFLARILPGKPAEEPAFMVSVSVFTNMGQFTRTGLSSGISENPNAIANIFMSATNNPANAYLDGNILTHINGIESGSTVTLNIALVDFDNIDDYYIKSGTKVIINVPTGFTDVTAITPHPDFSSVSIQQYVDGSTQVTAELSQDVGDIDNIEAKVLSLTAKAPVVTSNKIYIMHTLLDGLTQNDFSVGALAEMPLQVVP